MLKDNSTDSKRCTGIERNVAGASDCAPNDETDPSADVDEDDSGCESNDSVDEDTANDLLLRLSYKN